MYGLAENIGAIS